jgi:oligopeptide transport system ATP-binding protein
MSREKVLEVKDLTVSFKTPNGLVRAVREVSFDLHKGETLAIVGESGSGKSVTNRAIMGILARNAVIDKGEINYRNQDLTKLSEENFHKIRGNKIGMIFQDPLSSLNPIMRIGKQITEAMLVNGDKVKNRYNDLFHHEYHDYLNMVSRIKLEEQKVEFKKVELKNDDSLTKAEKKSELASYKAKKKQLIAELKKELPALKAKYQEAKKKAKEIVDQEVAEVNKEKVEPIANAKVESKKALLIANKENVTILEAAKAKYKKDLEMINKEAVDAAKAELNDAKAKAKTAITNAKNQNLSDVEINSVRVEHQAIIDELQEKYSQAVHYNKNIRKTAAKELKATKKSCKARVNEAKDIYRDVVEMYARRFKVTKKEAYERAIEVMTEVGIPEPRKRFRQYPFQFSGGMRQRIVIAIALTANPELLICDEPTTALDVTIQGQILGLIKDLKKTRDLSVIFITHDLGVVANMADRVAVMYAGKIVEYGSSEEIFYDPKHPYTWALLSSVPDLDTTDKLLSIPGTPPDMLYPPKGDAFAERNKYALKIDFEAQPPYFKVSDTHYAATWLLHPDAPKIEMPSIIAERIARYKADNQKRKKMSEGDLDE